MPPIPLTPGSSGPANIDAIADAQRAMAVLEQLETVVGDLGTLHDNISLEFKADVAMIKSRAESLFQALDGDRGEEVLRALHASEASGLSTRTKIARLGIGSEIIRLRFQEKMPVGDIADRFSLSVGQVKRFCTLYQKLTPLEKIKERNRSIMDFVGHWEEMGALIYRMLAKLEHDPENHVRYIAELRQLLKNVESFQARYTAQQELEQVKEIVKEILIQELPAKRDLILARFQDTGVNKLLSQVVR